MTHGTRKDQPGYEDYKEYMRIYMLNRYHKRMEEIRSYLGGVCVLCGSELNLEIHHKDRDKKKFTIGNKAVSIPFRKIIEEIKECELLCKHCHIEEHRIKEHGNLSMYRYCKCDDCKKTQSDYNKEYYKTHTRKRDRK